MCTNRDMLFQQNMSDTGPCLEGGEFALRFNTAYNRLRALQGSIHEDDHEKLETLIMQVANYPHCTPATYWDIVDSLLDQVST